MLYNTHVTFRVCYALATSDCTPVYDASSKSVIVMIQWMVRSGFLMISSMVPNILCLVRNQLGILHSRQVTWFSMLSAHFCMLDLSAGFRFIGLVEPSLTASLRWFASLASSTATCGPVCPWLWQPSPLSSCMHAPGRGVCFNQLINHDCKLLGGGAPTMACRQVSVALLLCKVMLLQYDHQAAYSVRQLLPHPLPVRLLLTPFAQLYFSLWNLWDSIHKHLNCS